MGEFADEKVNRMTGDSYIRRIENKAIREYHEYWDSQYADPSAWSEEVSCNDLEQTDKALLVTRPSGFQVWVPKEICKFWTKRTFFVHKQKYLAILEREENLSDLLPDLGDADE